ncbi:MAG TPA: sugar phosphate isomerase/epimerase family protein [Isosphaeraceae bacterium]|jgi:hexulose-6-phosphate isomerase|nr:sugar phosphate isomerase/epimerase family protein [Isosphaeraceae bacterium]
MTPIDRRRFLGTTGLAAAGLALAEAKADATAAPRLRKAFMLGGDLRKGQLRDQFRRLKDAGFEGVEINSPNDVDRDEVLQARDSTGLVIHGVCDSAHWKDTFSDPDPKVVARGVEAAKKAIADCAAYGGTTVLLVPAVVNRQVNHRDAYARSQAAIKQLIPDAERHKVKLAIEEVWNKFLLTPPEFARYIDEFRSPAVGAYFDVGNVVEYGYPEQWIKELGKRILKVHIKEYAKPKRFDYLLGEGKEIDWPAVRRAFDEVGYHGWVTAEVPGGDLDALKDVVRRMDRVLGLG